ncbi:MAG: hypothetical protein J7K75_08025 [Desulfuromonas sp.]|nr:hypothetical protein [Desulfuromonas sp.]
MSMRLLLFALLFSLTASTASAQQPPLFSPHIEHYSNGWIDWDNGLIFGTGRAYTDNNNQSRQKTLGAAQLVAAANIVKLASGLQLDDRRTLEKLGNGTFVLKLKAFLRYREHRREFAAQAQRPYAEITLVTPLNGIEGLTAQLLNQLKKHPLQWQKFPLPDLSQRPEKPDAPWLVIDGRNLAKTAAVEPGLFPKICASNGQTLYDLNRVHQSAMTQRGLARYVHSNASIEQILMAIKPQPPSWWALLNPVGKAWAEQRQRRPRYIVANAQQAKGMARTNLVISSTDATRLRQEDIASQILKNCRVIVITSAPVGGIEGRLSTPLLQL